jgi:hypothetical protein
VFHVSAFVTLIDSTFFYLAGIKLWIPSNSDHRLNSDWLFENFPPEVRFNSLIFVGKNVLRADVIRSMYR